MVYVTYLVDIYQMPY